MESKTHKNNDNREYKTKQQKTCCKCIIFYSRKQLSRQSLSASLFLNRPWMFPPLHSTWWNWDTPPPILTVHSMAAQLLHLISMVSREGSLRKEHWHWLIWAMTCDFQQYGILTSVDSDEHVQPPFKLRNSKLLSGSSLTLREYPSD